jgi:hypothetical protein
LGAISPGSRSAPRVGRRKGKLPRRGCREISIRAWETGSLLPQLTRHTVHPEVVGGYEYEYEESHRVVPTNSHSYAFS